MHNIKQPAIYIMANNAYSTLYLGVTGNLIKRVYQHKNKLIPGFSAKYNCDLLVYYELHTTMRAAINREKQLKGGSRIQKISLIESLNPDWKDLYRDIVSY